MSRRLTNVLLLPAMLLLAACGGGQVCDEVRVYQEAQAGKHIESPDGLDPLPSDRELSVPKASPQAPKPPGTCIDAPPTLRTGSSDS